MRIRQVSSFQGCLWIEAPLSSPNLRASDLGMFVVAVGKVMEVAAPPPAVLVAARL